MKVSIITTIYKAEKDLPRLLDSMMALESPELEFFLIDNGSPDRCGEICAEYASRDSRFKIRTIQDNIGYIRARMLGLIECDGDFIGFADSDDFLEPDGYDKAIKVIKEQDCDLYIASYHTHSSQGVSTTNPPYPTGLYSGDTIKELLPQAFGFLNGKTRLQGFMWKQIYRRQILIDSGISLLEKLKPWEDQVFNIDMINRCQRVYVDNVVLYNYIANDKSLTANMMANFDADSFLATSLDLFIEKRNRAKNMVNHRANANALLMNLDQLVVNLCKNKSLSALEVKKKLKLLFNNNSRLIRQILSESSYADLSKRLTLIKFCLSHKLYSLIIGIIRLKLK